MIKKKGRRTLTPKPVPQNCIFCKTDTEPNYKNYQELLKFTNERSKIVGRDRSGICAKHQRRLGIAIKRARHLGLLNYASTN